jgi:hypothetical protein
MRGYIIGPERGGEGVYSLVAEDGECIGQHYCSSSGFARGDLTASPRRQAAMAEKGVTEVEYVTDEAAIAALIAKNAEWAKANGIEDESVPTPVE